MTQIHSNNGAVRDQGAMITDWADAILSGRLSDPGRERWQPLRAGLVNIFLFEDERFPFADGRLLLRGINATGKSRVLAFMLPFLLDANLHPTRLEPDRDATRQVAWNLLMGEHHDRLGYTWIEFGRRDPVQGLLFLTLGCGLKAVQDRGIVEHWFFTTTRRIDDDLALVTPQRTALTKRQLAEVLGDQGQVFERATDYRRSVDDQLFRLGDRYEYLMELLLSLRQPQLAKKLDPEQLESALKESLPPLSDGLLAMAAEAFRSLDMDRRKLAASHLAHSQTEAFLEPYRQHVRIGLVRAADVVRNAQRALENANRNLRDTQQAIESLSHTAREHEAARQEADSDRSAAEATLNALQQSDAARTAGRLTDKSETVQNAELAVQRLEQSQLAAKAQTEQQARRVTDVEERLRAQRDRAARQSAEAAVLAVPEALVREHHQNLSGLVERQALPVVDVVAAFHETRKETDRWQQYAERLSDANRVIDGQRAQWRESKATLNHWESEVHNRQETVVEWAHRVSQVRAELWQIISHWFVKATQLFPNSSQLAVIEPLWTAWAENAEAGDPLATAVDEAYRQQTAAIACRSAAIAERLNGFGLQRQKLSEELQELESGRELAPLRLPTRNQESRVGRRGAPLWKLVDFAPTVPAAEHAGWEAALEASGLLDAWLSPEARLEGTDHDTFLTIDDTILPHDRQLARVLIPSDLAGSDISRETLIAILDRIGIGEGGGRLWIDPGGRWQNGLLTGRWHKEDAEFVGGAARERHRQKRIDLIAAELKAAAQEEHRLELIAAELQEDRNRLDEQRHSLPSNEPLLRSLSELATSDRHAAEAQRTCQDAAQREQKERQRLNELLDGRNRDAHDMGLAEWADNPQELVHQLDRYLNLLQILERDLTDVSAAIDERSQAQAALAVTDESLTIANQNLLAARQEYRQHRIELETLERNVGAEAIDILHQIETAKQNLKLSRKHSEEQLRFAAEADAKLTTERSLVPTYEAEIHQCDQRRREAVDLLQARAARGLIEVAKYALDIPAIPWSLTQGVDIARRLHRTGDQLAYNDEVWNRSQVRIHELRETLRAHLSSYDLSPEPEFLADGLQLIHVPFRGTVLRIDQLAQQLGEEIAAHERVLSEQEREIFEKFLLGEVGWELHRRMHEAAEQVVRMNGEVASRPMSTGMQMRFRWELAEDASPELLAARDVLLRLQETWSSDERTALIGFLQRRIHEEQLRDPAATWQAHLENALDYRRWHTLRIDRRGGPQQPWRLLTRRTYGSLSGGEKAIALTIPQCAAASAYYGSADPLAPRLILLDEAFAGVSTDNRSSCLELLVSFDLDVVMTSENERGCYPAVPALAICRLSRAPDLPVVLNDVFVWNGKHQQGPAELPQSKEVLPLFATAESTAAAPPKPTSANGEPS